MDKYLRKKEIIKEIASNLFENQGFTNTTMEMIAGNIGMKKKSLYHYYKNKDEILSEIIKDSIGNYFSQLSNLKNNQNDVLKFLIGLISYQLAFIKEKTLKYSIDLELFYSFFKR